MNLLVICLLLMSVVAAFTAIGSITTIPTTSTLSLRMFSSSSSSSNSRTGALLLSSPSSLPLSSLALSSSSFDAKDTPTASNITTDDTNDDGDDKNLSETIAEQKKILLKAVGKGNTNEILKAAQELEQHNWIPSSVSGRWSLVFSTMSSSENEDGASPLDDIMKNVATDASLPRKISDAIYKVLFRFLPALAGGQEQRIQHKKGNRNSSNSNNPFRVVNEQIVDINTEIVINTVDLRLVGVRGQGRRSWGDDGVRICVRGTATPIATTPSTTTTNATTENNNENVLEIIFTETSIGPIPNTTTTTTNNNKNSFLALLPRILIPTVTLPLPRPVGIIRTTFCDNTVRLSRGSRGGLFVLKRIKD